MPAAPGDLFEADSMVAHRYRVIAYRGDRGFGQVYEALDAALDRPVALMRLRREFSRPETRERFYETRSTAAVEDPRIVDLCDYGEDVDGRLFLVMPWVARAEALDELLAREGALAWPRVRAIIEQIVGALDAAHRKGVLHGSLEPSRVLIDERDGVHIVDFGLAPALAGASGREVTMSGPLLGRIEYFSPEQVRGESLDARSDIYSLGVMLWTLIAGKPPFAGDAVAIAEAHLRAPLPELPRRRPVGPPSWTPAEIEPLLHLALAKDPGERIASAAEFSQLLAAIPSDAKPEPKPPAVASSPPARLPPVIVRPPTPPTTSLVDPPPPPPPPAQAARVPPPPAASPPAAAPAAALPLPAAPAAASPPPVAAPVAVAGEFESAAPRSNPQIPRPAKRKRKLGKLELAILVFLTFDVLLLVGWKLFFGGTSSTADEIAVDEPRSAPTPADAPPSPTQTKSEPAEPEPAEPEPAEPEPELEPAEPERPRLSVHEAIAAEFPPEPDTPGPVRSMAKSLSDKALREAMVAARDEMVRQCLDTRVRRTLKVALKVAPSGTVEYARVVGSLGQTALGRCVVKQVYRIEFPPTYEGGTHTYTLRLR